MNRLPVRFCLLILFVLTPVLLYGQLSAPGSNGVRYVTYPSSPSSSDPVFVYCNTSGSVTGTLYAVSPGGTGPFTFSWFRWSDATGGFTVPVRTDTGVTTSTVNGLGEGGYR
ncbi:MAG: hypothetical protein WCE64_02125, partial [Bacteroidales bacterium]